LVDVSSAACHIGSRFEPAVPPGARGGMGAEAPMPSPSRTLPLVYVQTHFTVLGVLDSKCGQQEGA